MNAPKRVSANQKDQSYWLSFMHIYTLCVQSGIFCESDCDFCCHQISYMISAWARMCKIFGTEFTQYLPLVMPSVMKAASIKPEVAVIDGLCQIFFNQFEIICTGVKVTCRLCVS